MGNRLRMFYGILVIYLGSGIAFADTPASLAGRRYSNSLQVVEFSTTCIGRVIEGGSEVEFSYEYDEHVVSFEGDNLRPEFLRMWLIKDDGRKLVSADGRISLSLVTSLPVSKISEFASDLLDVNACPPSFCRGTNRCWYTVSNGNCVVNYCHHTKSCE
jgi:hypothetical protein